MEFIGYRQEPEPAYVVYHFVVSNSQHVRFETVCGTSDRAVLVRSEHHRQLHETIFHVVALGPGSKHQTSTLQDQ